MKKAFSLFWLFFSGLVAVSCGQSSDPSNANAYGNAVGASLNFEPDTKKWSQRKTVYILLHGLNSDARTWDTLVDQAFAGDCPTISGLSRDQEKLSGDEICIRYNFLSKKLEGQVWLFGDGSSYPELGVEVGRVTKSALKFLNPDIIVYIGHSRGGLAARSYIQSLSEPHVPLGLLTVGSPHMGSQFGRIKHFLTEKGTTPQDYKMGALLRLLRSPSTGDLSISFDERNRPVKDQYSRAIFDLNSTIAALSQNTDAIGVLGSDGIELGKIGPVNVFSHFVLKNILPKAIFETFAAEPEVISDEAKGFVLENTNEDWLTGDSIVPFRSQNLENWMEGNQKGVGPVTFKKTLNGITHMAVPTIERNEEAEDHIQVVYETRESGLNVAVPDMVDLLKPMTLHLTSLPEGRFGSQAVPDDFSDKPLDRPEPFGDPQSGDDEINSLDDLF